MYFDTLDNLITELKFHLDLSTPTSLIVEIERRLRNNDLTIDERVEVLQKVNRGLVGSIDEPVLCANGK